MKTNIITRITIVLMLMVTPFVSAQDAEELLQQGDNYLNGIGVEMNYEEAFRIYRQLADMENAEGMNRLASMYRQGFGVEQDLTAAIFWYQKAADVGLGKATFNLGNMIKQGEGMEQDNELAFEFFVSAYQQGYIPAAYSVGYCYFKGLGVEQNYAKALEYFQACAEAGHPNSTYFVGLCYIGGYGVAKNINKGQQHMETALALGSDPAEAFITENKIIAYLESGAQFARSQNGSRPQYGKYQRRVNTAKKELSGEWTGKLLCYDWSGKQIEQEKNLVLNLQFNEDVLTGTWVQEDSIAMTVTGHLQDTVWIFDNMQYLEFSLERPWELRSGGFQIKTDKNQQTLEGSIEQFSPETREPAPPVALMLTKTTVNADKKTITGEQQAYRNSLTVSPNPFSEVLEIQFSLESRLPINLTVCTMAGQIVYNDTGTYDKGISSKKLRLAYLNPGTYCVKIKGESVNLSTLAVKNK